MLLVHTAIKDLHLHLKPVDLDLTWTWLLLDLILAHCESRTLRYT